MLIVDNKVINSPIKNIFENLLVELSKRHINKLDKVEYRARDITVTCPFHSDGHERTPSCNILLENKGDVPAGTFKCFGCGASGSFLKFISNCLELPYRKVVEWLLNNFEYSFQEDVRQVNLININTPKPEESSKSISLEELKSYDYIHPYMFKRKLTDEIVEKFEVGYDPKLNAITFPVYVNGICEFVCKRSVKFKRFYMPKDIDKPIYGLDYITENSFYVTESIINCLTLWSWGYQAVALFGTGSASQLEELKNVSQRKIILALDGDVAGRNGTQRIKKALQNKIVTYLNLPDGKDVNDLTKEEFEKLSENL